MSDFEPMAPADVSWVRDLLGLSLAELARWLRLSPENGARMVRDWESGRRPVTGPAGVAMQAFAEGFRPRHVRAGLTALKPPAPERGVSR